MLQLEPSIAVSTPLRRLGPLARRQVSPEPIDQYIPSSPEAQGCGRPAMAALALLGGVATLSGCASMPNGAMALAPAPVPVASVKVVSPAPKPVEGPAKILATLQEAARLSAEPEPELPGAVKGEPDEPCPIRLCERVIGYDPHIEAASEKFQVDPNLIRGVIAQESQGHPKAGSHKGAKGLMQLMPATARSLGVKNRVDPKQNIMGGTRYLSEQLEQNDGDVERALWAYNAGPGNLAKGVKPAETRNYIQAVQEYARQFRDYVGGGSK
ncbi:transglycosylase SLT domain-containing protein [bacterium]|nr:transglycosylase SLT domain-containing protein [bacterium]